MATTGFWPVKGRLKDVINYAQNPDKTTDRRFLDDDLAATLNYVENSDKTDQTMYVSGINCTKKRAYEQMMTTKRRFGKLGGNVAYHGYQSFQAGEVTPDTERKLLEVVDEIQQRLLLPEKSSAKQICKEVTTWQQQASGPSKDG